MVGGSQKERHQARERLLLQAQVVACTLSGSGMDSLQRVIDEHSISFDAVVVDEATQRIQNCSRGDIFRRAARRCRAARRAASRSARSPAARRSAPTDRDSEEEFDLDRPTCICCASVGF